MLNRTIQPAVKAIERIEIAVPERRILANGVPLHLIHAGDQEVVRLDVLVSGGQWDQVQPLQAMFTNRMLREGTRSYTSSGIAEKLDYYGAWMELSVSMEYTFLTLYSLNKYARETLALVESMLKEPVFPEKELSVVAEINKQQFLVNNEKTDVLARKQLNSSLFGPFHPCGQFARAGDYDRLTPGLLRRFYEQHYSSGNSSVYVSGKVTDQILASIEKMFGTGKWGSNGIALTGREVFPIEPTTEKRVFIERPEARQSSVRLGALSLDRKHPDFHSLKVLVTLFGGYFGSRLMSNIREDKGYTYGIGSGLVSYPGTGMLVVSTETGNEYAEAVIREVHHEMDVLCQDLVPEAELSMVRNYMLGEMCRSYEGPFSLSDAWIFIECGGLDDSFYGQAFEAIQSATPQQIRELAQKYLRKETLTEVIAGKKM